MSWIFPKRTHCCTQGPFSASSLPGSRLSLSSPMCLYLHHSLYPRNAHPLPPPSSRLSGEWAQCQLPCYMLLLKTAPFKTGLVHKGKIHVKNHTTGLGCPCDKRDTGVVCPCHFILLNNSLRQVLSSLGAVRDFSPSHFTAINLYTTPCPSGPSDNPTKFQSQWFLAPN